jgi:hypothetical protein
MAVVLLVGTAAPAMAWERHHGDGCFGCGFRHFPVFVNGGCCLNPFFFGFEEEERPCDQLLLIQTSQTLCIG